MELVFQIGARRKREGVARCRERLGGDDLQLSGGHVVRFILARMGMTGHADARR